MKFVLNLVRLRNLNGTTKCLNNNNNNNNSITITVLFLYGLSYSLVQLDSMATAESAVAPSIAANIDQYHNKIEGKLSYTEYLQNWFYNLTERPNYQKWARPVGRCVTDQSTIDPQLSSVGQQQELKLRAPIIVNMSLELYNYATVNELTSEYTFQFFLDLEWCDERLVMPKTRNENKLRFDSDVEGNILVEGGNVHIDRIWKPSIFVANNDNPGSIDYDAQSSNMVRIDIEEGHIWLRKRKLLHIYCMMDFSLFPFDRQKCYVHFESNVHSVKNLQLQWQTVKMDKEFANLQGTQQLEENTTDGVQYNKDSFQTIGFRLIETKLSTSMTSSFSQVNYSRCTFAFTLEREYNHYLVLTYLPSGLIVVVSWSTFWLEITSPPARVSLGVTTMLALVTSFKSAKAQLPTISYMNVLDIWNLACTIFIALSLIEFALVNYIYNTNKRYQVKEMIRKKSEKFRMNQRPKLQSANQLQSDPNDNDGINQKYLENALNQILANQKQMKKFQDLSQFRKDSLVRIASINAILKKESANFIPENQSPIGEEVDRSVGSQLPNSEPTLLSYSNISVSELPPKLSAKRSDSVVTFANDLSPLSLPATANNLDLNDRGSGGNNSPVNGILKRPLHRVKRKISTASFDSQLSAGTQQQSGQKNGTTRTATRRRSILMTNNSTRAIIKVTPEEMANNIDLKCRIIFPSAFALFNLIYWIWLAVRIKQSRLSI